MLKNIAQAVITVSKICPVYNIELVDDKPRITPYKHVSNGAFKKTSMDI